MELLFLFWTTVRIGFLTVVFVVGTVAALVLIITLLGLVLNLLLQNTWRK